MLEYQDFSKFGAWTRIKFSDGVCFCYFPEPYFKLRYLFLLTILFPLQETKMTFMEAYQMLDKILKG